MGRIDEAMNRAKLDAGQGTGAAAPTPAPSPQISFRRDKRQENENGQFNGSEHVALGAHRGVAEVR